MRIGILVGTLTLLGILAWNAAGDRAKIHGYDPFQSPSVDMSDIDVTSCNPPATC